MSLARVLQFVYEVASKVDLNSESRFLNDSFRCACGREDDVSQFFECPKCSSLGFCLSCLYQKHWKHDVNKVKPLIIRSIVVKSAEKSVREMGAWILKANTMDEKVGWLRSSMVRVMVRVIG